MTNNILLKYQLVPGLNCKIYVFYNKLSTEVRERSMKIQTVGLKGPRALGGGRNNAHSHPLVNRHFICMQG